MKHIDTNTTLWTDNSTEHIRRARLGFRLVNRYIDSEMYSQAAIITKAALMHLIQHIYVKHCEGL